MNPDYTDISLVPVEISWRDQLGVSIDTDKLDTLAERVTNLLKNANDYRDQITALTCASIFDLGNAAQGGASYIISRIKEIKYLRSVGKNPADLAKPAQLLAATKSKTKERVKALDL
jgi:hypothetical protein